MEGKKSFVLYTDLIEIVEELDDNEAGLLFKTILRYVNDLDPEIPKEIKLAFIPIKQDLKRDLKRYEERCKKNQENARKRWDKEETDSIGTNTTENNSMQSHTNAYERTKSHSDNDNDNDSDNDSDNDNVIKEKNKKETEQALSTAVDVDLTDVPDILSPEEQMFNEFWKLYPKKVDKKGALRSFKRVKGLKKEYPAMLEALNRELASEQWNRNNGQYIPHPTTWLNQERWKSVPVNTVETEEDVFKRFLEEC